jgi:hypothetical protein
MLILVIENTMLRIFAPRKEEETGGWRKLHNEFFVVKGPAADATDAPQPSGLLCNTVMKMI